MLRLRHHRAREVVLVDLSTCLATWLVGLAEPNQHEHIDIFSD